MTKRDQLVERLTRRVLQEVSDRESLSYLRDRGRAIGHPYIEVPSENYDDFTLDDGEFDEYAWAERDANLTMLQIYKLGKEYWIAMFGPYGDVRTPVRKWGPYWSVRTARDAINRGVPRIFDNREMKWKQSDY